MKKRGWLFADGWYLSKKCRPEEGAGIWQNHRGNLTPQPTATPRAASTTASDVRRRFSMRLGGAGAYRHVRCTSCAHCTARTPSSAALCRLGQPGCNDDATLPLQIRGSVAGAYDKIRSCRRFQPPLLPQLCPTPKAEPHRLLHEPSPRCRPHHRTTSSSPRLAALATVQLSSQRVPCITRSLPRLPCFRVCHLCAKLHQLKSDSLMGS